MNITISTEAVATKELCGKEIPFVPNQGQKDTITKLLLVRVRQPLLLPRSYDGFCAIPNLVQINSESCSLLFKVCN